MLIEKIIKYIVLALALWNLPSFGISYLGSSVGSLLSTMMFGLIFVFFFLAKKSSPPKRLVVLSILYFLLAGISYDGILGDYIKDMLRYFIFLISVATLAKHTTNKEFVLFMSVVAVSIIIHTLFFPSLYGRYSGFYINPNRAGGACLVGYALTYTLKNMKLRYLLQVLITIAGVFTFSRYFLLLWFIINALSLIIDPKNIRVLLVGLLAFTLLFSLSSVLELNTKRFEALESIFSDDVDTKTITEKSRSETWSKYYDVILENPVTGIGYQALQGRKSQMVGSSVGVHNTYLMIIGESGIVPFLLIIYIYISLITKSLKSFKIHPEFTFIAIILITTLLVTHNYFDNYLVLFTTVWVFNRLKNHQKIMEETNQPNLI